MTERVYGIDVSRWQDNNSTAQQVDFTKAYGQGARFVFIKSSQTNWADEDILYNWKSSKDAGLLRGAYHFLTWDVDPRIQAQYAWSIIKNDPGELPPVCDFEWWGSVPSNAYDKLWNYVIEMERLSGKKPIIYTGAYFWKSFGTQAAVWKDYPLWLAYYGGEQSMYDDMIRLTPWYDWTFWQYSSKGDGLAHGAESKDLDMNLFNGSYNDLLVWAGIEEPTPPPVTIDIDPELMLIRDALDAIERKHYG